MMQRLTYVIASVLRAKLFDRAQERETPPLFMKICSRDDPGCDPDKSHLVLCPNQLHWELNKRLPFLLPCIFVALGHSLWENFREPARVFLFGVLKANPLKKKGPKKHDQK